jgi:hypothetical protein
MPQLSYGVQAVIAIGSMSAAGYGIGVVAELIRRKVSRANTKPTVAQGPVRLVGNDRRPKRHYAHPLR